MNKIIYLLRGLPGSGKSTVAENLSENGKYPVLSADMFFEDEYGNYNWDGSKIKDAHAWCKEQVERLMQPEPEPLINRYTIQYPDPFKYDKEYHWSEVVKIFVANTFTQEWEMEDYFKLAEKYGYMVVTMIVENRHGNKSIHDVSDETIDKMASRFQIKLK
jgi:hypothetical protein